MYEDAKFLSGSYPPVRTPDPNKKNHDYYLHNAFHIYSTFYRGGAFVPYSATLKFRELRAFAQGLQPEDFYKRYLSKQEMEDDALIDKTLGYVGNKKRPKGFMKPIWEILSPAPKIVSSMVGTLTKTQTDICADPIDNISKSKTEDEKLNLWVTSQHLPTLQAAHQAIGIEMPVPDFIPENQDELDLYDSMGGFKPAYARVMEKMILHTMDISDWTEIENKLYRDAITLGVCGVREYYEPEIGKYKIRVCDPSRSGIQYSEFNNCRTSEWGFEFRDETITKLIQQFPDKDSEYFQKLAFQFCGYMGNPAQADFRNYTGVDTNGFMKYDFFKVPVMDVFWMDNEGEQQVVQTGKRRTKIYEADYSEKINEVDGKKARFTMRRYCYGATWVIGTSDIYNWGKCNDNAGESRIPFHFYVWDGKSIIQQLIPLFHNFQVLWLKYLNALALAVNSGYWVNADMLANIATGGDVGSMENDKEIALRRFLDTGLGFYSRINATGTQNLQDMPMSEFRGGMGQIFTDIMAAFQFNMQMVESITGINPIVLGSTPNPNAPVGTTQMSVAAVASVFKPLLDGFMDVKLGMSKNVCRLIHICSHAYKFSREQYARVVGDFDMQVLLAADRDNTEYAIRLQVRPGDLEKQKMIEMIQQASMTDRDGNSGGLSGMEGIMLIRRLESGIPMSQVELEFEYRKKRNIKAAQEAAAANSQANTQSQMAMAQQAAQLAEEAAVKKHGRDLELQQLKNQGTLAAVELQEGLRHQKESEIQALKTEAERYIADSKANTQRTTDYVKADTAKVVEGMKSEKKEAA